MKLIIDIPEEMYLNAKADILCGGDILVKAIKNGIPHETVTEFADRCSECGAKLSEIPTDSKDVIWYSKRNYSEIVVEPQESEDKE